MDCHGALPACGHYSPCERRSGCEAVSIRETMKTGMPNRITWIGLTLATMLLAGCSEAPKTETAKQPEKVPEPVTGRQAFQMMYPQARRWAMDAQPFQLRSIHLSQVKSQKGKAGAWQAIFVSPSQS